MADLADGGNRSREIFDGARDIGSQREADAEAGTTARRLETLEAIRTELGETPSSTELLEALRGPAGMGLG